MRFLVISVFTWCVFVTMLAHGCKPRLPNCICVFMCSCVIVDSWSISTTYINDKGHPLTINF